MNFIVQNKNKIFEYIENVKSDNLGFYFSLLFHFIALIFTIGLPNFFEPKSIYIPTVIPIEIVNVTDVTTIVANPQNVKDEAIKEVLVKEKKFNSSNNQEIKKLEINEKKTINKNEIEKKIIPKEKKEIPLELEKKEIPLELEKKEIEMDLKNVESLPTKKIKPKIKPKFDTEIKRPKENLAKSLVKIKPKLTQVKNINNEIDKIKPKEKPNQDFNIATMLKDLRNEKTSKKIEKKDDLSKDQNNLNETNKEISNEKAKLSISEIDLLRQQLSSCWVAPAGAVIEKGMLVKISAKLKQNRRIFENSVRIIDTNISKSNSFYGPITESAMRTLLNPDCIPLKLPREKYNLWKNLTITFDYSIMKGY